MINRGLEQRIFPAEMDFDRFIRVLGELPSRFAWRARPCVRADAQPLSPLGPDSRGQSEPGHSVAQRLLWRLV